MYKLLVYSKLLLIGIYEDDDDNDGDDVGYGMIMSYFFSEG